MADDLVTLDIGENNIHIVKAGVSGGRIDLSTLGFVQDTPPIYELDTEKIINQESEMIKKLVDYLKIGKKNLNVVIPDAYTYSQIVEMPRLKEKELLSAIRYQADQFIPMPMDETSLDLEILNEDKNTNKLLVLIVASSQKLIEKIEKLSERVGLYPDSIENELSASARFFSTFYKPLNKNEEATIFVNLGYSTTSLYFFSHAKNMILDQHNFRVGLSLFLKEAQADVNVDLAKAKDLLKRIGFVKSDSSVDLDQILSPSFSGLTNEMEKFFKSVKQKFNINAINRIFLFNRVSDIQAIERKIEEFFSIPSKIIDIYPLIKKNSSIDPYIKELPSFISSIGGCIQ